MNEIIINGLNFIENAVDTYFNNTNSRDDRLKYSVINFYIGLELLLKSRLSHEHYSLIISNIKNYKKDGFKQGDFVSINFNEIVDRLEKFCEIKLDEKSLKSFQKIRLMRNKYIHFHYDGNEYEITNTIYQAWHHLLKLLESQTLNHMPDKEWSRIHYLRQKMFGLEEFVDKRFKLVKDEIEKKKENSIIITCPYCGKKSMYLEEGGPGCIVCGIQGMISDITLRDWLYIFDSTRYDQGEEYIIGFCSACEQDTVIRNNIDDLDGVSSSWFCFNCLREYNENEFVECQGCNKYLFGESDVYAYCNECYI